MTQIPPTENVCEYNSLSNPDKRKFGTKNTLPYFC